MNLTLTGGMAIGMMSVFLSYVGMYSLLPFPQEKLIVHESPDFFFNASPTEFFFFNEINEAT